MLDIFAVTVGINVEGEIVSKTVDGCHPAVDQGDYEHFKNGNSWR